MENFEKKLLMEVSDDGDLEEYDFSIVYDAAVCQRCENVEHPKKDDEYGSEAGIYHCYKCREEIKLIQLENYSRIIKLYPEFKDYINEN